MKILLLIPFNQEFKDVSYAIHSAAYETKHELFRLDEVVSSGSRITDILYEEIEKADLIIADISGLNPNVMYELGIVKYKKKPTILIAQEDERKIFDLTSSIFIFYDRKKLNDSLSYQLKKHLQKANITDLIKANAVKPAKPMIFISYSHVDFEYLARLKVHLKPFEKKELVDIWSDTKIKAGEKWKEQIEKALKESAAAILLISADFLASDFIIDNELPPLLKSAEEEGKVILPVVLKPCRFSKDENLSKFQAINDPSIPLSKMDENGREDIYVKIADYIGDLVK